MKTKLLSCITILLFLFPKPAYAYLDPGTGSYLFQILIAGLLGSLFFVKSAVKKVKEFFKKKDENK
ncbi:MAG: hypothetical protein ABIC96_03390 [Patescibacteria group bacterium]